MNYKIPLIGRYGFAEVIWLVICFSYTRIFFHHCRLIRLPIFLRGRKNIIFGSNFVTGYWNRIDAYGPNGLIVFGKNVQINDFNHIAAIDKISIGDDVLIASRVFISDHNHGLYSNGDECSLPSEPPINRVLYAKSISIEDRVWIGEGVVILPGVTIGCGSVIGAGSVVNSSIPPNSIAVGVPARVVRSFNSISNCWTQ